MSNPEIEKDLQEIVEPTEVNETTNQDAEVPTHHRTNYRRRDLRNSLESHIGYQSKKRCRIDKIPLYVSDFTIEDMINEIEAPIFLKFYETKENRSCIFEYKQLKQMEEFVTKYNNFQINPDTQLVVEIYEQQSRKKQIKLRKPIDSRSGERFNSSYGSHYDQRNQRSRPNNHSSERGRGRGGKVAEQHKSLDELDAELDAYMKNDS